MKRFIEQENVYKLDSWPLPKKKYHPISTNPKIGVRGGGSYCAPTVNTLNMVMKSIETFLEALQKKFYLQKY